MSAPAPTNAAATAGAKRKRDSEPTGAPAASPSATAAASSSSNNEPKRARLVAVPVTAADVAHFEEQQATARAAGARALPASANAAAASLVGWKGARILVDTVLEVLASGHVLVHMDVCFDGVSRRLARKQGRIDATAAKHREKKVTQKHKQKAKRHEAQEKKKQLAAQMSAEGKTPDEIRAFFREKYSKPSGAAGGSRSAKLHRAWILEQMSANALQKVVIDCSFDALMKLEEVCSLAKQIKYIYGHNIRSPRPLHLILSSLTKPHEGFEAADVWNVTHAAAATLTSAPAAASAAANIGDDTDMKDVAAAAAASTVAASSVAAQPAPASSSSSSAAAAASSSSTPHPEMYLRSLLSRLDGFDRLAFDRFEEHYLALPARLGISPANLVYLTAESSTVLTKLDAAKTYVIGGIVDHNRMKGLCHSLALRAGLATARLPIQEHLVNHRRTVITVNQVFEMLLHAQEKPEAEAGKVDWTAIMKEVLPARSGWKEREIKDSKAAKAEDDEEEDEKQQEQEDDERNQRLEKQAEAEPDEAAAGDEDAADDAEACTDV